MSPSSLAVRKIAQYGWRPDHPDGRDRVYQNEKVVKPAYSVPIEWDCEPQYPSPYDQFQVGACTGNAIAGEVEHISIKQSQHWGTPSRLFIYQNEMLLEGQQPPFQDNGAEIRDGIKVVATQGTPTEQEYPYVNTPQDPRFSQEPSPQVYQDAKAHEALVYRRIVLGSPGAPMRTAIASNCGIVFGFSVPDYFEQGWNPATTPLPLPSGNTQIIGGHAVVVVGYDFSLKEFHVPVFKVRNSWGSSWGTSGYFFMDYRWFDAQSGLASDLWVIEKES